MEIAIKRETSVNLYDQDLHVWAIGQAELMCRLFLKSKRLNRANW